MRKLWLLIVLGLSWWGMRASTVSAEVSYDPAQGGVFWEPPAEMSIPRNVFSFIPFAYAPPGDLFPVVGEKYTLDGKAYRLNNGSVIPDAVGIVTVNNSNLGFNAKFENLGDYQVELHLKSKVGAPVQVQLNRIVIVHVTGQLDGLQLLPLPEQHLLSPLPTLLETTSSTGRGFLKITEEIKPDTLPSNAIWKYVWKYDTPIYYVYPPVLSDEATIRIVQQTQKFTFDLNGQHQSRTLTYGLADITAIEGRPITLDALYLKPMPGTKLTFNWTYTANDQTQTVTSDTPSIPIPDSWHADGSIYVTLIYSYNDKSVAIKSNTVSYHYQPQVLRAASTFGVSDLLQRDIHVNARIADWSVTQTGDWQLEVAVSPVQTTSGVRMPAALILPGGTQVAGGETKRLAFSGDQVLALTQAEWLLQQQPAPIAGQYNTTVRFTVISGPE